MNNQSFILSTLVLFMINSVFAQNNTSFKELLLTKYNFKEYIIPLENDSIYFYLHKKKGSEPKNLVLYLQGTSPIPEPFFNIEKKEKGYAYMQYIPTDYNLLDENYAYAIISYVGTPAFKNDGPPNMKKYHQFNSLDYRVFQADTTINYITEKLIKKMNKVIVYGHSEGAFVAPKLATVNKRITHLGVWGGSALPDFFDFILFERKANLRGVQSDSLTQKNINETIKLFQLVAKDSSNTLPSNKNEITEYTNKRWWSYAEPTINHLLKIDIPIYIQLGTEDESSPIESNYLIPLEFARLGKKNLSFNVCVKCDHGFTKRNGDKEVDMWSDIFINFIKWTN